MMKDENGQIERIIRFEEIFERAAEAAETLSDALDDFATLLPEVEELEEYYGSKEWKKDFSDDEKGFLPSDLRRGVLSEDGVFDLLERINVLRRRIS